MPTAETTAERLATFMAGIETRRNRECREGFERSLKPYRRRIENLAAAGLLTAEARRMLREHGLLVRSNRSETKLVLNIVDWPPRDPAGFCREVMVEGTEDGVRIIPIHSNLGIGSTYVLEPEEITRGVGGYDERLVEAISAAIGKSRSDEEQPWTYVKLTSAPTQGMLEQENPL